MRRPPGTGTIERWRGQFRARLPTENRDVLGVEQTYDAAASLLDGWLAERQAGAIRVVEGATLRAYGVAWLDRRELDDYAGIGTDRSRWLTHIETATFIEWPLANIRREHVIDWLDGMKAKLAAPGHAQKRRNIERRKLSRSTIQNTLNLLRCCLADALERRAVQENPADGVRLRMKDQRTEEPWTYLTHDEQLAVFACEAIPAAERLILAFAIGTGLREGELWNLELRDLHVDGDEPRVFVRFGSKGKPPKHGRTRTVPLFGYGLDAARAWLAALPAYADENPEGLVFPSVRGCRRRKGKPPGGQYVDDKGKTRYRFHDWLRAAGIERGVRFHDLRHTCASSLVSGLWEAPWGLEPWRLELVRDMLGHKSVKTTERYAHLAPSALQRAASPARPRHHEATSALAEVRNRLAPPTRLELVAFGLGRRALPESGREDSSLGWRAAPALVASRVADALDALADGDPHAVAMLTEAARDAAVALLEHAARPARRRA